MPEDEVGWPFTRVLSEIPAEVTRKLGKNPGLHGYDGWIPSLTPDGDALELDVRFERRGN